MKAKYRFVFFDVDSTLVTIEGIDVLAGGDPRVAALTAAAMGGEMPIEQVYARRLEMIRPSRTAIQALAAHYLASLTPGAEATIDALRASGAHVHLVTGGLAQAVAPLAAHLGVPPRAVHSVELRFDDSGNYEDFERGSFLTRAGGKELIVRDVRARSHGKAAFVGDGASDLEAKAAVELFVGFGGVRARDNVRQNADVWIEERDLRAVLPHLIERHEA